MFVKSPDSLLSGPILTESGYPWKVARQQSLFTFHLMEQR